MHAYLKKIFLRFFCFKFILEKSTTQPSVWSRLEAKTMIEESEKMNENQINSLFENENYNKVVEGKARVYFPKTKNQVFYNPIQEFNRDLSIAG